jgi:hypothetical protein
MKDIKRLERTDWSKPEKEIARRAYRAAYDRECAAIADNVSRFAAAIKTPPDMWQLHDYLTEKRKETDEKYDYRYSVLLWVFGRLMYDGWIREEDLAGLSPDKLQEIRQIAGMARI